MKLINLAQYLPKSGSS